MTTWIISGTALAAIGTVYRLVSGVWHALAAEADGTR